MRQRLDEPASALCVAADFDTLTSPAIVSLLDRPHQERNRFDRWCCFGGEPVRICPLTSSPAGRVRPQPPARSASTSTERSTGLVSTSSQPECRAKANSSKNAWDVTAMTTAFWVRGCAFRSRATSHPSIAPGKPSSTSTTAGSICSASISPVAPVSAQKTPTLRQVLTKQVASVEIVVDDED